MDADAARDQRLLHEISRITAEYGALHRRAVRDVVRARTELAAAQTVLGSVAHDLRTPLSAVVGFTELLLDQELTPAQRDLGERIDHAARALTALTEDLLTAVTVGTAPLRFAPVDVTTLVTHVVTHHQLLQPPRGVRVVLAPAPGARVWVEGDETKLERLLDNLVSNAVKFSPVDGVVRVSVGADGRDAVLRVSDEGPGVPEQQLEDIFAPFHRSPTAAGVPGVGLGLTIVKELAERHGGRVHVESVLGQGATFVVELPLGASPRPGAPPLGAAPPL